MNSKYLFDCYFSDNSGKKQHFQVKAKNKQDAIEKAFAKAKKNAKGELSYSWEVKLIPGILV